MQSSHTEKELDEHALLNISIAHAEMNNTMAMPQPFNVPVAPIIDNEVDP